MLERFADRRAAGQELAQRLTHHSRGEGAVVLALPRGGVPVGYEVARALGAPLDVFVVRKLGVPGHEELAMGAIASGGVRVVNTEVLAVAGIQDGELQAVTERERRELQRREGLYRGDLEPLAVAGRTVIVVDDGLATGATMRAAIGALRERRAARIVAAVPVASRETCSGIGALADEILCDRTPEPFVAVGLWYEDFSPTTDEEVRALLAQARADGGHAGSGASSPGAAPWPDGRAAFAGR